MYLVISSYSAITVKLIDASNADNYIRVYCSAGNSNDVSFVLEIVPTFYVGDINPCLAPSLDVIDFCHATRTEIDIDMYVYDSTDE